MARQRSLLAGWTDYTGVGLDDICDHFSEWRNSTAEAISVLRNCGVEVDQKAELLEHPQRVKRYIDYFLDLLGRYLADVDRLIVEMPRGVRRRHIEIVEQIYRSSEREEDACIRFKNDLIERSLRHEEVRLLLDTIYAESRQQLIEFRDFSNLAPRLRTFVEEPADRIGDEPILELKPSLWGIGLNLRPLWQRLRTWSRKR